MTHFRQALGLAVLALVAGLGSAEAQQVGATTVVTNDVSRLRGAQRASVAVGDTVFRNEVIQTGTDSTAKIVFLDQTNLSIGPNARIALNQYVYSEERPGGKVALNLLRGTYRFVTGDLDKRSYEINTPVATIGVRGTIFDVSTTGAQSVVTLVEGEVRVCARSGRGCLTLDQPGQVAVVTSAGASRGAPGSGGSRATFDGLCAANPSLCTTTRLADSLGGPQQVAAAGSLCGR